IKGRETVRDKLAKDRISTEELCSLFSSGKVALTPGTAVFMTASPRQTAPFLKRYLDLTDSLKQNVVLLSFIVEPVPHVNPDQRLVVKVIGEGIYRVIARYGFAESPDAPMVLNELGTLISSINIDNCVFFLGRETLVTHFMPRLWKALYRFMSRNSMSPALYFNIPPERVIEIGVQIEL
ncbi:MAG: potassium transporter Kup, partial [Desulfobacteraceae bacterium]|nr:potassium transporter Kup [Desulfobacteraceae bacterium]